MEDVKTKKDLLGKNAVKVIKRLTKAMIEEKASPLTNVIEVDASCKSPLFSFSLPMMASNPVSTKSSADEDVFTVIFDSKTPIFPQGTEEGDPGMVKPEVEGFYQPGVLLYDVSTGLLYTQWADSSKFQGEDEGWKPGYFYTTGDKELFYGDLYNVYQVGFSTGESERDNFASQMSVTLLEEKVKTLQEKLDRYPAITDEMLKDGIGRVLCNGKFDDVFPSGSSPLYQPAATAMSLALSSVNNGKLMVTSDTDPEMIEEVKKLLGEELFNELATKNVQTMELQPVLSPEERLKQAIAGYYQQKADFARMLEEMKQTAENIEATEVKDVEPKKEDKK